MNLYGLEHEKPNVIVKPCYSDLVYTSVLFETSLRPVLLKVQSLNMCLKKAYSDSYFVLAQYLIAHFAKVGILVLSQN